ncbi:hypothetical protein FRC04_009389 [Tulasnella sp. 424]|nr:hypothetical protein FRC04_009389 [Tulasnella sp. 424]
MGTNGRIGITETKSTSYWLGEIYRMRADYPSAARSFIQAQKICGIKDDKPALADTSYWLGQVYRHQSKHAEAVESFIEAIGMYETKKINGVLQTHRIATQSLFLAKVNYTIIDDEKNLADTLYQLAQVDRTSSRNVEAERFLVEARAISTRIDYGDCHERASRALDEIRAARMQQVITNLDITSPSSTQNFSKETGVKQEAQVNPAVTVCEGDSRELNSTNASDIGPLIYGISLNPVSTSGKFGDVFEGRHKEVGRVALKRPRLDDSDNREDIIRRFLREPDTWGRLEHTHVLKFMGTINRGGWLYLVSPSMENGNLIRYIKEHPSVNRIRLLRETADGINYLHTMDIIHGDIEGPNILISNEGGVLLCDFGLSKMKGSATSTCMRGAGSTFWMGPELLQEEPGPKAFESDVYAFGMTIAEASAD